MGSSGAGLDDGDDRVRVDEPGQVVDVAVGVVAVDAPAQPDDVADAEVVGEDPLHRLAVEPGVAGLDLAEQALLGRQQRAAAVDVDAPPSSTTRTGLPRRAPRAAPSGAGPAAGAIRRGMSVVVAVVVVLGPGVELPVDQARRAGRASSLAGSVARLDHERRARSRGARRGRSPP